MDINKEITISLLPEDVEKIVKEWVMNEMDQQFYDFDRISYTEGTYPSITAVGSLDDERG